MYTSSIFRIPCFTQNKAGKRWTWSSYSRIISKIQKSCINVYCQNQNDRLCVTKPLSTLLYCLQSKFDEILTIPSNMQKPKTSRFWDQSREPNWNIECLLKSMQLDWSASGHSTVCHLSKKKSIQWSPPGYICWGYCDYQCCNRKRPETVKNGPCWKYHITSIVTFSENLKLINSANFKLPWSFAN